MCPAFPQAFLTSCQRCGLFGFAYGFSRFVSWLLVTRSALRFHVRERVQDCLAGKVSVALKPGPSWRTDVLIKIRASSRFDAWQRRPDLI